MHRRSRITQIGIPAAVLGALAASFTAAPAQADAAPLERSVAQGGSAFLRVVPASTTPATYVVRDGDTISSIAGAFGLRTVDVLTWNGLSWRSVIYPGQTLQLTAPAAPAPAPAAPAAPASSAHVVVAGDTVFGIAQKYGTTVNAVLTANGLDRSSVIYPGQTLTVAAAASASAPAPASTPAPAPAPTQAAHTVVAGDTIFALAKKYGTSVDAILAANGMDRSSIIYPGQTLALTAAAPAAPAAPAPATVDTAPKTATLDAEQADNAALIIRIGRELGVSDKGIATALATSMVESWMRNLDWGDRDSLGLFQQRPSTGWGTAEQIRDRERSIRVFYGGAGDPNGTTTRGLLDIAGWESMSLRDAAQAVQISAYPDRYSQWEAQAYQWLALYG